VPGAFASIELVFDEIRDAMSVPAEAVVPELGGARLFVYEGGRVATRVVEVGIREADRVQIVSGISPQDTVITTGVQQLRAGMPVRINVPVTGE
jgi:membrane fusion protein, multidrug efflux system